MDEQVSDLRAAWALYQANRPRDAMMAVGRYLRDDPDSSEALCLLAFCHREVGELELAIERAREAIEKTPNWAYAHRTMAWMRVREGNVDEAVHSATKAIELDSNDAWNHYTLGFAFERIDQYEAALESARRAVELAPTCSEFYDLTARCLLELGRKDEAAATVKEALRLDPENKNARSTLGFLSLVKGQGHTAREEFKDALRLDPNDRRAQHGYLEATRQGHWIRFLALGATSAARSRSRRWLLGGFLLGVVAIGLALHRDWPILGGIGLFLLVVPLLLQAISIVAQLVLQFVPALRRDTRALLPRKERMRLVRLAVVLAGMVGLIVASSLNRELSWLVAPLAIGIVIGTRKRSS